jgi:peptidoglycan-N-acetylglucosamine deacetylase
MMTFIKRRAIGLTENIFPGIYFSLPAADGAVYLTFDDGPHPESTPRLLELLAKHDARATFFCSGQNVEKYPSLYDSIIAAGHAVGNHTWSHLNGWTTSTDSYMADVERAAAVIKSDLFRPPFGRITPAQYLQIIKKYRIIMWTRQFYDFRPDFNPASANLNGLSPGDILVLHDKPDIISRTLSVIGKIMDIEINSDSIKFPIMRK